ncbi:sensor histidine kinase [Vagococcus entomophilus]|uniref:ATPase n=1 Tax=Vagococcus entomophilus TaxID=1160095 RepID=A0A430AH95_9ENTE|nr:ATP-binding protein [Vagococcus entomophilus]RSU07302.1 ATPase [Vagococcus entomophilus]
MKEKFVYLLSSFVFLVIALFTIKQNDYLYGSQATIVVPIIVGLIIFCVVIIFISRDIKKIRYFAVLTFFTSISLVIGLFPYSFVHPVKSLIISFLPYFVYKFFITFNLISISSVSKKIDQILFIQSIIVSMLLLLNFEKFTWMVSTVIILDIFGCLFLYFKGKDRLTIRTKKEQVFLIRILVLSLFSLIISTSILSGLTLFLIPITVGIILIKRNEISLDKVSIIINLVTHFICIGLFFIINFYFLRLSILDISFISIFYCLILFILYLKNWYLSSIEIRRIQQRKKEFQKEKIDLVQTISKEKTLSSVGTLISKILLQHYEIDSYLMVWKDQYSPYILSSAGELSKLVLTNKMIAEFECDSNIFHYHNNKYRKFTFCENKQVLGWLLINKEEGSDLANMKHEEINELVCVVGKIIIENERLYDVRQEALKIESLSYDEYVNYEYLNMVQNFHKDFSFFIHDNVLQNILALKKLIESMSTEDVETKKLVLETFDTLNKTFRDKIFELYPSAIETAPLSQSIRILCDKFNKEHECILVHFYCPQETHLKKEEKFHIYRIMQELLTNALKHSQATKIFASLIQHEFYIEGIVKDDGIGFDYSKIKLREFEHEHFGILSINQEVHSLNGKMKVSSVNPHGTKFTITLPIVKEDISS